MVGKVFYTRPHDKITVLSEYRPGLYLVKDEDVLGERETREDLLLTTEQILQEMQPERQIEMQEIIEKAIQYNREQEKRIKEREAHEEQKRLKLEFTHGYTDRMTPMHKGRVLQILNREISTSLYGRQRRKDYIVSCVQDGREFKTENNVRRAARNGDVKIIPVEYQIHFNITNPDGTTEKYYQTITKTEYDYAAYLVRRPQATAGQATAGQATAGQATAGQATAGQATAGQATAGQATAGQATAGQATAGQVTAGQATAGQATAGQATAGQATAGQATAGQATAGQATAGQATAGQATAGQATAGQATAGQATAGQATAGQATAGQATAGQATAGQATAGQATAGQATAGQATAGKEHTKWIK